MVSPCFNEADNLAELHRRVSAACRAAVGSDYEIILVDDGSRDRTWSLIEEIALADPRVVGLRLSRNHGHQLAVTAGLSVTRGETVLLLDADLQDPPELLSQMLWELENGAEVVYGQRTSRQGEPWLKIASAALFYRLLSRLTSVPIPHDTGDFRLMSRRVVDSLLLMPESHRFIRGMVSWIGGRQVALPYDRGPRFAGATKYPLGKMIRFALDAITSFSTVPLRIATWAGGFTAVIALVLLVYTVVQWVRGEGVAGWASTMTAVAFLGGVQLVILGIIGEYVGRVVEDVKNRPLFLIDQIRVGRASTLPPGGYSRLPPQERARMLAELHQAETPPAPVGARRTQGASS